MNTCTQCGNKEDYDFALNEGLCTPCISKKLEELHALKEFARGVINVHCWAIDEPDGADIQGLAERLGLIFLCIATEEGEYHEAGDPIFMYSDILKEKP